MKYPIEILFDDLQPYGVVPSGDDGYDNKLLMLTHRVFYEFAVLTDHRRWRLALIEHYKTELEEQIKGVLINIALAAYETKDFNSLFNVIIRDTAGQATTADLQNILQTLLPPSEWNAILAIEPPIKFNGGRI